MSAPSDHSPSADAEQITSLRAGPPPVVRLSRKAVIIAGTAALTLIAGTLVFALRPSAPVEEAEVPGTANVAVAEGLATAPADYSQVPKLGPPLPGDLGKPILDARDRGAVAALPPLDVAALPPQGPDPSRSARDRIAQEHNAARGSRLFFGASTAAGSGPPRTDRAPEAVSAAPPGSDNPMRQGFLDRAPENRTRAAQSLAPAQGTAVLQAGSVIPAALITGIRSDQPGLVTAQVTENVHDSLTGRRLLIPQGSRLIGDYEADISFGQRRVLLAWNRLVLPDGRSIVLERQPAADPSGFAGLEDRVDFHWGSVARAALVSTLLGLGAELGMADDDGLVGALRRGSQDSFNRAGEQIVSRELNIRPTLTIRPGYPVRVMVTRDIAFHGPQ